MVDNIRITGQLDINDFIFPAPAGGGDTRADEFDLSASLVGQPLTIALTSTTTGYDPFLQVINAETGRVLADSDDDGDNLNSLITPGQVNNGPGSDDPAIPNSLNVQGGVNYKIRVSSYGPINTEQAQTYELQVSVPQGEVDVTPRNSQFGNSETGQTVDISGQLDGSDFTFPSPTGGGNISVADEYELSASVLGQPLTISVTSRTSGYNPFLQVINAETGQVLADSDDISASNLNSRITPGQPNDGPGADNPAIPNSLTIDGGVDYRIRVSSSGAFPTSTVPVGEYDLQVSTPQGEVTVSPRVTVEEPSVGPAVYRFYNTLTGVHFYTASAEERDDVIDTYPQFNYEGESYNAASVDPLTGEPVQDEGTPVFRFYNTRTQTHFYTISEEERDTVIDTYPQFDFEGTAYYAYDTPQPGTTELHRFYNVETEAHFYTPSAQERDNVIDTYPQFNYEGVGYYVNPLST